jgi:3-hydroxyisobutyrate dehydrogenase
MAKTLIELPTVRAASIAKLSNNIAAICNALGTLEALRFGVASGLETAQLFHVLEHGTASSYVLGSAVRRAVLEGDINTGFAMRLAVKDLRLAAAWADRIGIELPYTAEALRELEAGVEAELGDLAFPAVSRMRAPQLTKGPVD